MEQIKNGVIFMLINMHVLCEKLATIKSKQRKIIKHTQKPTFICGQQFYTQLFIPNLT